ncbi:hypothetical protein V496_08900 [Pseudogymnoascus sp. VKM F-4515 (FW-2607)]|nr:hypothetical protein V496_08900 [Pseudogymnoascus sp. VKM F-4515 (FW-2607)]
MVIKFSCRGRSSFISLPSPTLDFHQIRQIISNSLLSAYNLPELGTIQTFLPHVTIVTLPFSWFPYSFWSCTPTTPVDCGRSAAMTVKTKYIISI